MPPRQATQAEAVAAVLALARARPGLTTFVGLDGPGGAGKSTLAWRIASALPGAAVVAVDDFSGPQVTEWDWLRFREQLLLPLLAGRAGHYQRWDWDRDQGGDWLGVTPGGVVVVEGVSSTRAEAAVPWELTIWVETPRGVRQSRAIDRDGLAMHAQWTDVWIPSEEAYFAAQLPRERADLIVVGVDKP